MDSIFHESRKIRFRRQAVVRVTDLYCWQERKGLPVLPPWEPEPQDFGNRMWLFNFGAVQEAPYSRRFWGGVADTIMCHAMHS